MASSFVRSVVAVAVVGSMLPTGGMASAGTRTAAPPVAQRLALDCARGANAQIVADNGSAIRVELRGPPAATVSLALRSDGGNLVWQDDAAAPRWPGNTVPWRHADLELRETLDAAGQATPEFTLRNARFHSAVAVSCRLAQDGVLAGFSASLRDAVERAIPLADGAEPAAYDRVRIGAWLLTIAATVNEDPRLAARALVLRAWSARRRDHLATALVEFAAARQRFEALSDPRSARIAALDHAQVRLALADYPGAEAELATVAAAATDELADIAAVADNDRCVAIRVQGKLADAESCYRGAITRFVALGLDDEVGNSTRNLATLYMSRGDLAAARAALDAARAAIGRADSRWALGMLALVDSQVALREGRFDAAAVAIAEALAQYRAAGDRVWQAQGLVAAANLARWRGDPVRAESDLAAAAALADVAVQPMLAVRIAVSRAVVAADGDDAAIAVERIEQARQRLAGSSDLLLKIDLAVAELGWALKVDDRARAGRSLAQLHDYAGRQPTPELAQRIAVLEVAERAGRGDVAGATRLARELLDGPEDERPHWLSAALGGVAADAAWRAGEKDLARRWNRESLRAIDARLERARSPAVLHVLDLRWREAAELAMRMEDGDAQAHWLRIESHRRLLWQRASAPSEPVGSAAQQLAAEIDAEIGRGLLGMSAPGAAPASRLEERIDRLQRQVAAERRADPSPVAPTVVVPPAGTVLLDYFLGERGGHLHWLDADGVHEAALPPRAELLAEVAAFDRLLQSHAPDRAALRQSGIALQQSLALDRVLPAKLDQLWIVADAELSVLSWSALPSADPAAEVVERLGYRPLAADLAIANLPHAGGLAGRAAPPSFDRLRLYAILGDLRPAGLAAAGPRRDDPRGGLSGLPGLERERRALAPYLHDADDGWTSAGSERLWRALSDADGVVHVGAHGWYDRAHPEQAGLWLDGADGTPHFIGWSELVTRPVAARLVVLNACLGAAHRPSGSITSDGLAANFLLQGAGAAVASAWAVDDEAAADFVAPFYRSLAAGASPQRAVSSAQAELWRQRRHADPRDWAGYGAWIGAAERVPNATVAAAPAAR